MDEIAVTRMSGPAPRMIVAPDVPAPKGHYSHAVRAGGLLYISGQLPLGPEGMSFEAQVRSAMSSLLAILAAAGGDPARLVKVTAYIVDIANWGEFNRVYAQILGDVRPARAIVPVPELHHGHLVEIEAVAAL